MIANQNAKQLELIEEYFRAEYADMLSFAKYLLDNHSLAEVAVQETFVFVLEHPEKMIGRPSPAGSLYTILKNIVRHMLRDEQKVLSHMISIECVPEREFSITDNINFEYLSAKHDPDMRLLARFYIFGCSIQELANEQGITVGACKMRIKRAKERLQDKLK
ncbi:MAG: sigma factor-like helix-turn-helix DNA-binding protein [Candidatus Heteroscillospira sp.]|jgi:RNA polymerase sigma factor (sigma-70 family)